MKKVVVFLADGFEEVEGLTVVDLLRRAGAVVETVSVMGKLQIDGFKNSFLPLIRQVLRLFYRGALS